MSPEEALETWPLWTPILSEPPRILCKLENGLTNESWLVDSSAGKSVLRISNRESEILGIDRGREAYILKKLAGCSFFPEVFYQNPVKGILVTGFCEGQVYTANNLPEKYQRSLAEKIAAFQQCPIDLPPFNYSSYLEKYWQKALEKDAVKPDWHVAWRCFFSQLESFQNSNWNPVLTHHDLQGDNIIVNKDGLCILDWEYAAKGHPAFDYFSAGLISYTNVKTEDLFILREIMNWMGRLWWVLRPGMLGKLY